MPTSSFLTAQQTNVLIRLINNLQLPVKDEDKANLIQQAKSLYLKSSVDINGTKACRLAHDCINRLIKQKIKNPIRPLKAWLTPREFQQITAGEQSVSALARKKQCVIRSLQAEFDQFSLNTKPNTNIRHKQKHNQKQQTKTDNITKKKPTLAKNKKRKLPQVSSSPTKKRKYNNPIRSQSPPETVTVRGLQFDVDDIHLIEEEDHRYKGRKITTDYTKQCNECLGYAVSFVTPMIKCE
eukprot:116667_1